MENKLIETTPQPQSDSDQIGFDDYMKDLREWADIYIENGFSIIPIRLGDKNPAVSWKEFQTRQPSEEEVDAWFNDGVPDGSGGLIKVFGLAIVTGAVSNLVVVDCDNQEALQYALNECGCFSNITVKTTRGNHLYFRHPGYPVQNKVGGTSTAWPDVVGLDLRGDGGYVVAPPSLKYSSKENKFVHQYKFETAENFDDALIWMPTYKEIKATTTETQNMSPEEFSFENLCLDGRSSGDTVWEEIKKKTTNLGRKLKEGEGRNIWATRYVGYCVSLGMDSNQTKVAVEQFMNEFFLSPLPASEYEATIRSVIDRDKQTHPERYEAKEAYNHANPIREGRAKAISLITPKNLAELRELNGDRNFLIDPYISPQSITQIIGFNGHGKTLWLMSLLWSASLGQDFGAGSVDKPLRVLYLDYELSATTITDRVDQMIGAIGDMPETMCIWAASISDIDLDLNTGDGINNLRKLLDQTNPQVVVIDTVRSAWQGMEENSPASWVKVNQLCMAIRNTGRAVVFVHHRNKPSATGFGREAGSTAQLKDLDTQVIVTKVIEDREQAEREAALPNAVTKVVTNNKGAVTTAWEYLRNKCPQGAELTAVFQVAFGKVRQISENHETSYIGLCTDIGTGKSIYISSLSPRQRAEAMYKAGKSPIDIALQLKVPRNVIQRWVTKQQTKEE